MGKSTHHSPVPCRSPTHGCSPLCGRDASVGSLHSGHSSLWPPCSPQLMGIHAGSSPSPWHPGCRQELPALFPAFAAKRLPAPCECPVPASAGSLPAPTPLVGLWGGSTESLNPAFGFGPNGINRREPGPQKGWRWGTDPTDGGFQGHGSSSLTAGAPHEGIGELPGRAGAPRLGSPQAGAVASLHKVTLGCSRTSPWSLPPGDTAGEML